MIVALLASLTYLIDIGAMFFGAPKVRGLLGVGLWVAMVVPMLKIVALAALASCRADYRAPAAAAAKT